MDVSGRVVESDRSVDWRRCSACPVGTHRQIGRSNRCSNGLNFFGGMGDNLISSCATLEAARRWSAKTASWEAV